MEKDMLSIVFSLMLQNSQIPLCAYIKCNRTGSNTEGKHAVNGTLYVMSWDADMVHLRIINMIQSAE